MTLAKRSAQLLTALLLGLVALASAPAIAATDDAPGGDDNAAVAVNTTDGASLFRLAFSVRKVSNSTVDQTNKSYALASCTDCQTVALAFQVILVKGDSDIAVPENQAVAYNEQCVECLTYASATQIVLGFDGVVRFTKDGRDRLRALEEQLLSLEGRLGDMSLSELDAEIQAAKVELIDILSTEIVEADSVGEERREDATTTTLTTDADESDDDESSSSSTTTSTTSGNSDTGTTESTTTTAP